MFIVEDRLKTRINSLDVENTDTIKEMCSEGELLCPECRGPVEFRAGKIKRSYFAHKSKECSYPYGEAESEQHMNGKLQLATWLEMLYPSSQVELEYKISETNQRSDVLVLHPSGERWAFEYQCSPIPGEVWEERHQLYKAAGIRDFWILGSHLNDWKDSERPNLYLRRDLERAIFNEFGYVYYFGAASFKGQENNYCFNILRGGKLATKTILEGASEFTEQTLNSTSIMEDELWNEQILEYFANRSTIIQLEDKPVLYSLAYKYLLRLEQEKAESEEIQRRKIEELNRTAYNEFYQSLVQRRKEQYTMLTYQERKLFHHLCNKHGFTLETLPGFFFSEIENAHLIKTPPFVWQLWIYDQFIFNQKRIQSKKDIASVWVPTVNEKFKWMKRQGYFQIEKMKDEYGGYYIFAPGDFIDYLSRIGVTKRRSIKNSKFHEIISDYIHPSSNLQESIFVEWNSFKYAPNLYLPEEIPRKVTNSWNDYWKRKN
ncbi:competence protein CoiA [Cytobacillus firmus]|uniref:Competence protein n=1 Tax=Cytobacillus firmus DS1 TaxID=1307436 RepID=W7KML2_CYTFI|nr:competence protein CoiA family protein [Cytobacillus firmus]EWG08620.1 Competence protein [Cytobacillus firmus DS1]